MATPYGSWTSPITSDAIVSAAIGLGQIRLDGDDIYWVEQRPTEGGRNVIVQRTPDDRTVDRTPAPLNARTRVHEYGGGSFTVSDGTLYFSDFAGQRLYRQGRGEAPEPLTPEGAWRYASGVVDPRRNRFICVREDHTEPDREAVNTLVSIDLDNGEAQVMVSGNDFYAAPRLSPDGAQLAWMTWNHPNMPWDGSELWVGEIGDGGALGHTERVAGGVSESIFQPEWSPDGILHFVSDRTAWWNLYRWRQGRIEPLCAKNAEFGQAQWVFGLSNYTFLSPSRMICCYTEQGTWHLASLDTQTLQLDVIETPYTDISGLHAAAGRVVFTAGSPTQAAAIVQLDPNTQALTTLRRANDLDLDPGYISSPEPIEFPTAQGRTAHALYYAPANRDYTAPAGERPPLIVKSHGGPTSAAPTTLNLGIQYWTSRGFAVLDVNYGGSTGYGRAYRQRLNGQWGIVDVEDCANGARYLVERGDVDGNRLAITGGSAGGYTTLCALTFHDTFSVGASHYGISDLEALAGETHKFESRYLDSLIGPYPEREDLYKARSPIHFTDRLSCPLILFQGLEDQVVPPNQAEMMAQALRDKGLPVAYVPFEGEQHGFRRAENIKRALDGELYFYSQIFRFELGGEVEPVEIENL
ncbi:S9 family peptidase [Candidatus Entotheonella palauensis]|uniref:S9 family peptidase n=1 Tax=Candidatus Entotheonella palauensis TaxID=93172 RepID=UPI000B7DCA32|nr:S9 family peptidase [Candidatus Entotheonella palauensis]